MLMLEFGLAAWFVLYFIAVGLALLFRRGASLALVFQARTPRVVV